LAVNVGAVATPLLFVTALAVSEPPLKVAPAPLPGAVKVTVTPLTGVPESVTVARSGVEKAVFTVALWGVPPLALTLFPATASAAPFKVTLPVPDVMIHFTVKLCPALPALYVSV
jgi:hypothetical protein